MPGLTTRLSEAYSLKQQGPVAEDGCAEMIQGILDIPSFINLLYFTLSLTFFHFSRSTPISSRVSLDSSSA